MLFYCVDFEKYYTSENNKYISAVINKYNISDIESIMYVLFSIHKITDRIIILPSYPCEIHPHYLKEKDRRCNFMKHWSIEELNKFYENKYREHSFLSNNLVPQKYKNPEYIYSKNDSIKSIINIMNSSSSVIIITIKSIIFHHSNIQGIKRKS